MTMGKMGLSRVTSFTMWVLVDFAISVDTDGSNTLHCNYGEKKERENNLLLLKTDTVLHNAIEFILNSFKMTIALTTTNLPWEAVLWNTTKKKQLGNLFTVQTNQQWAERKKRHSDTDINIPVNPFVWVLNFNHVQKMDLPVTIQLLY